MYVAHALWLQPSGPVPLAHLPRCQVVFPGIRRLKPECAGVGEPTRRTGPR